MLTAEDLFMKKLINFCGKHRKLIYAILTIAVLLLLCFPIRDTVFPTGAKKTVSDYDPAFLAEIVTQTPFFFASFYWLYNVGQYNVLGGAGKQFFFLQIFSFAFLIAFAVSGVMFWLREIKGKQNFAIVPLLCAFLSHTLLCFKYAINEDMTVKLSFFVSPSFVVLIVLICLYTFAVLFGKLYPRMQPKIAETVTKVADKVKSHKSKSERLEELERQNAEMQKRLDELEKRD